MEANPDLVETVGAMADVLLTIHEGDASVTYDTFELPDAVLPPGEQTFAFDDETPYYGIRLSLDHEIKLLSEFRYFVHPVSSIFYKQEDIGHSQTPFMLLGIVDRADQRQENAFNPPFALAVSADCLSAWVVPRVSDEELEHIQEARAVKRSVREAYDDGVLLLGSHMRKLREEAATAVSHGLRDPRLSHVAELALLDILEEDGMIRLTATGGERRMLGLAPERGAELKFGSVSNSSLDDLLAAQARLAQPDAYEEAPSITKHPNNYRLPKKFSS